MATSRSWTKAFFVGIWSLLNVTRKVFFNIVFILIAVGIGAAILSDSDKVSVPTSSALVLNLQGDLVIQARVVDPLDEFMQEAFDQKEEQPEVLLQDVLFAIENAKQDRRIKALVLKLEGLGNAGLDKLKQIADAIEDFKGSEKPVYAIGDYYTQNQYYLAAHADKIYLNPMGWMMLEGYGKYRLYFKSALEKIKATTHVFRVGTYKSAIEPLIRDDMSDAAKEANQAWLNNLWSQYKEDVSNARGFSPVNFDEKLDNFIGKFEKADGDFAQYALENGWVDALVQREDIRLELAELVGKTKSGMNFKQIGYESYLKVIKPPLPNHANSHDQVGIVVAKGAILNGTQKPGTIGGDSTARLLRKARLNDDVKAVVLYVDSPGGSAFASEIIRQEVELLKAEGKPVVAAMSTYAASGGYWISASADKIIAAPSTITGSIGVFGMLMTYENTLDYLGLHTDGVGTTDFAGFSVTRPLDPQFGNIFQLSVEQSYDKFISLVSEYRDLDKQKVDEIAQGRVWIGDTAKQLGLVDEMGYLQDAVVAAADLAQLTVYDTRYIERSLTPKEKFWKEFFGQAGTMLGQISTTQSGSQLLDLFKQVVTQFDVFVQLNDPKGVYAYCLVCKV